MIATHNQIPKVLWDALHAMGLPANTTDIVLRIPLDEPVTINCTFYPDADRLNPDTDELDRVTKTFVLVEQEPEADR